MASEKTSYPGHDPVIGCCAVLKIAILGAIDVVAVI